MHKIGRLTKPYILYARSAVLSNPHLIPDAAGIYAWYFKAIPGVTPTDGCLKKDDLTLLYIGISPKNERSRENLRKRISYHYRGNAEGSTLRLTLGVLLADESGFPLRRVGSGKRMTFTHLGEQWLDDWMEENAFVCWLEHSSPWEVENEILSYVSAPLNIQDNAHHPFSLELSKLRRLAKSEARKMPVAREDNQQRRVQ